MTQANARILQQQTKRHEGYEEIGKLAEDLRRNYLELMSLPIKDINDLIQNVFIESRIIEETPSFLNKLKEDQEKKENEAVIVKCGKGLEFQSPDGIADGELCMPPYIVRSAMLCPTSSHSIKLAIVDHLDNRTPEEESELSELSLKHISEEVSPSIQSCKYNTGDYDSDVEDANTSRDLLISFEAVEEQGHKCEANYAEVGSLSNALATPSLASAEDYSIENRNTTKLSSHESCSEQDNVKRSSQLVLCYAQTGKEDGVMGHTQSFALESSHPGKVIVEDPCHWNLFDKVTIPTTD